MILMLSIAGISDGILCLERFKDAGRKRAVDVLVDELAKILRVLGAARFILPSMKPIDLPEEFMRKLLRPREQLRAYVRFKDFGQFVLGSILLIASGLIDHRDDPDSSKAAHKNIGCLDYPALQVHDARVLARFRLPYRIGVVPQPEVNFADHRQ